MSGIYLRCRTQRVRGSEPMGIMQRLRRSFYAGLTLCGWLAVVSFPMTLPAAGQSDLPDGPGKALVERICSGCHGVGVFTDNRNTKERWGAVVDDMVSRGAEGSDEDVNLVIAYLTRNFGKPVNINTATAKELETDLSFTAAEAQSVMQYRTDKGAIKSFDELAKVPGLRSQILDEQKKNIVY